jgi:hypothetical protein
MKTLTHMTARKVSSDMITTILEGCKVIDTRGERMTITNDALWDRTFAIDQSTAIVRGSKMFVKGRVRRRSNDRHWGWMVISL